MIRIGRHIEGNKPALVSFEEKNTIDNPIKPMALVVGGSRNNITERRYNYE